MQNRYVLLVRHASRARRWRQPEAEHPIEGWIDDLRFGAADSRKPGLPLSYALAGQLCDQLESSGITVTRILHGEHLAAEQTAKVFGYVLSERGRFTGETEASPMLTPGAEGDEGLIAKIEGFESPRTQDGQRSAYLLVGHQPQLTRIAKLLLKKSLPGNVLPIGGSEIACIELGERRRLLWLLTEKPDQLLADLKAKISSKYDVAKFFLGALVVSTGLTLNNALWETPHPVDKVLAGVGAFAALVSLALTAATLFSYDRLLMPQAFWLGISSPEEQPRWSVSRPPSQAHVILYYEMVHIWTHFFIPAICFAFGALGLFVVVLAHRGVTKLPQGWWTPPVLWWALLLAFILLALIALLVPGILIFRRWKPRLGFDD